MYKDLEERWPFATPFTLFMLPPLVWVVITNTFDHRSVFYWMPFNNAQSLRFWMIWTVVSTFIGYSIARDRKAKKRADAGLPPQEQTITLTHAQLGIIFVVIAGAALLGTRLGVVPDVFGIAATPTQGVPAVNHAPVGAPPGVGYDQAPRVNQVPPLSTFPTVPPYAPASFPTSPSYVSPFASTRPCYTLNCP
jgi:hypothetical protein